MFDKEKYTVEDINIKKVNNGFILEVGYAIKEPKEDTCGYQSETEVYTTLEEVFAKGKELLGK